MASSEELTIRRLWAAGYCDRIVEAFGASACSVLLQLLEEEVAAERKHEPKVLFELLCQLNARHEAIETLRQMTLREKSVGSCNVQQVIENLDPRVRLQIEGEEVRALEDRAAQLGAAKSSETDSQPSRLLFQPPRKSAPVRVVWNEEVGHARLTQLESQRPTHEQILSDRIAAEQEKLIWARIEAETRRAERHAEAETRRAERHAEAERKEAERQVEVKRAKTAKEQQLRRDALGRDGDSEEGYQEYQKQCGAEQIDPVQPAEFARDWIAFRRSPKSS